MVYCDRLDDHLCEFRDEEMRIQDTGIHKPEASFKYSPLDIRIKMHRPHAVFPGGGFEWRAEEYSLRPLGPSFPQLPIAANDAVEVPMKYLHSAQQKSPEQVIRHSNQPGHPP